jgi:hypothetical protein
MKTMNKSQMVRDMLHEMGMDASPTEISQKLASKGIRVTPNMVSGIKIATKKHGRKGRGRKAMRNMMATAEARPSIDEVYQVWALANRIGNDKLKQIVRHMP